MSNNTLRRTPLYPAHAELGANFTDFGGWEMPLRYTSDLVEHQAVRRSAGLFDLSHMGEVQVTGPQAAAALDHALVGNISKLALGRARYTMIVRPDGGIIDDLIVYHLGDQEFLVVPNAGNRERVAAELAARCADFQCAVTDASLATALIAVQGPRAEEILRGVVTAGTGLPDALRPATDPAPDAPGGTELDGTEILARLRYYAAVRATAIGKAIVLARTGYTGEDGFELFCAAEDALGLWHAIVEHAATLAPVTDELPVLTCCGLAARDSLRLEAGMPLYGNELTEQITPFDASLGAVVRLEKPGFVGRAALAERAAQGNGPGTRQLVALVGQGRRAARAGCTVSDAAGNRLGTITSGLLSPTLGHPIALALLGPAPDEQAPVWAPGAELVVDVRGRPYPMSVVAAPFYKRPS